MSFVYSLYNDRVGVIVIQLTKNSFFINQLKKKKSVSLSISSTLKQNANNQFMVLICCRYMKQLGGGPDPLGVRFSPIVRFFSKTTINEGGIRPPTFFLELILVIFDTDDITLIPPPPLGPSWSPKQGGGELA